MRIGIVAGEASGDLLAANLMAALKKQYSDIQFEGILGPRMQLQGGKNLGEMDTLSVMGWIEPIKRLPKIVQLRRQLLHHFISNPPDLFIGVDAPDFNLGVESKLKHAGIKTIHVVSPSVWAWRKNRINRIANSVNLILTLFPFEKEMYEARQIPVQYVGHPLADQIPLEIDVDAARENLRLEKKVRYVGIFPGSRNQELTYILPTLLMAAEKLLTSDADIRFVTNLHDKSRAAIFQETLNRIAPNLPIHLFVGQSHRVMAACDMAMITSGTATLELMLHHKPMVIIYKMSALTYWLAKRLVTPPIGLPNRLAGEYLVPELIQENATPEAIVSVLQDYLHDPSRVLKIKERSIALHQSLRLNAAETMAKAVLDFFKF